MSPARDETSATRFPLNPHTGILIPWARRGIKKFRGLIFGDRDRASTQLEQHEKKVQMERKTKPNITVINVEHLRLKAPSWLNKQEREVWDDVVSHSEPQAFKQREAHLLAAYCTAACLVRHYLKHIGDAEVDRHGNCHKNYLDNARLLASLATRLRLTPSSRYDARAADRHSQTEDIEEPWELRAHRDEESA